MLVFSLGGKAVLPEPEPYTPPPLNPPPSTASAEVIAHGGQVYSQYCSVCHGVNGGRGRRARVFDLAANALKEAGPGAAGDPP